MLRWDLNLMVVGRVHLDFVAQLHDEHWAAFGQAEPSTLVLGRQSGADPCSRQRLNHRDLPPGTDVRSEPVCG